MINILEQIIKIYKEQYDITSDIINYFNYCLEHKTNKTKYKTEMHHILPKSIFPQYMNFDLYPWNKVNLTYSDHIYAHYLIAKAMPSHYQLFRACFLMCNRQPTFKNGKFHIDREIYQNIYEEYIKILSNKNKGRVTVKTENGYERINLEEFRNNKNKYETFTDGKICVLNKLTNKKEWIDVQNYNKDIYVHHLKGKVTKFNVLTKKKIRKFRC